MMMRHYSSHQISRNQNNKTISKSTLCLIEMSLKYINISLTRKMSYKMNHRVYDTDS